MSSAQVTQDLPGGKLLAQAYHRKRGWFVASATAKAQGWLASPKRGKAQRFARRADALAYLDRCLRLAAPPRRYALASRCPPRPPARDIIACSSNHKPEEYHK